MALGNRLHLFYPPSDEPCDKGETELQSLLLQLSHGSQSNK